MNESQRDRFNERRDRIRRENEAFDRKFKWMFIVGAIVSIVFAAAVLALLTGGAVWVWGVVS